MCTGRSMTVCRSLLPGGGFCLGGLLGGVCSGGGCPLGGCLLWGGWCLLWGGLLSGVLCLLLGGELLPGVSAPWGWGCLLLRGVSAPRGSLAPGGVSGLGGVCSQGGVCSWGVVSQHALRQTPLRWTELTDRSKNITLATTSLSPASKYAKLLEYWILHCRKS